MATPTGQIRILHNGVRLCREVTLKKSLKTPEIKVCKLVKWAINSILKIYTQNTTAMRSLNENFVSGSFHLDIKGNERVNSQR